MGKDHSFGMSATQALAAAFAGTGMEPPTVKVGEGGTVGYHRQSNTLVLVKEPMFGMEQEDVQLLRAALGHEVAGFPHKTWANDPEFKAAVAADRAANPKEYRTKETATATEALCAGLGSALVNAKVTADWPGLSSAILSARRTTLERKVRQHLQFEREGTYVEEDCKRHIKKEIAAAEEAYTKHAETSAGSRPNWGAERDALLTKYNESCALQNLLTGQIGTAKVGGRDVTKPQLLAAFAASSPFGKKALSPTKADTGIMVAHAIEGGDLDKLATFYEGHGQAEMADMARRVKWAVDQVAKPTDASEVLPTAKALRQLLDDPNMGQPQPDNGEGDKGEGDGDSGDGEGDGEGEGEGDGGENDEGDAKADAKDEGKDGKGEGKGKPSWAQDWKKDWGKWDAKKYKPKPRKLDLSEAKAKPLSKQLGGAPGTGAESFTKQTLELVPGGSVDGTHYSDCPVLPEHWHHYKINPVPPTVASDIDAKASMMAQVFRQCMKGPTLSSESRHRRGTFDTRLIARALAGNEDVFRRQKYLPGDTVAVSLSIDISGSMVSNHVHPTPAYNAALAGAILSGALHRNGTPHEILWFDECIEVVQDFTAKRALKDRTMERLMYAPTRGGTNLDGVLAVAMSRLAKRPEDRKVLFLLTDGGGGVDSVKERLCAKAARVGMEIVVIGIDMPPELDRLFKGYGNRYIQCASADLARTMGTGINKILLRDKHRREAGRVA